MQLIMMSSEDRSLDLCKRPRGGVKPQRLFASCLVVLLTGMLNASAGVLPEDRADVLYHKYQGGGVTVDGTSWLVRKKIGEQVSVNANYYVDMVTSASIDVRVLGASQYKEERKQTSGGIDYLRGKTTYTVNFIKSAESDYVSNTMSFGISEDMFGDLTTVTLGFSRGWDKVYQNVNHTHSATFGAKDADHNDYRVGISQILTKHLILGLNYETQTSQGYLQNPYRQARYFDPTLTRQYNFELERYPNTHTTNAVALDARYYLPFRSGLRAMYRFYVDTWGVKSNTYELAYTQPIAQAWLLEGRYRFYQQRAAGFYSDLFPYLDSQNFLARDRELAAFVTQTVHIGATYELSKKWIRDWPEKSSFNFFYDRVQYNYKDFTDPLLVGDPLYTDHANVYEFFFSLWF